jgi:hypothetical protein
LSSKAEEGWLHSIGDIGGPGSQATQAGSLCYEKVSQAPTLRRQPRSFLESNGTCGGCCFLGTLLLRSLAVPQLGSSSMPESRLRPRQGFKNDWAEVTNNIVCWVPDPHNNDRRHHVSVASTQASHRRSDGWNATLPIRRGCYACRMFFATFAVLLD